jgi:hypothetical protein
MDKAITPSQTNQENQNARLHQIAATGKQGKENHINPLRDSVQQAWQNQRYHHEAWDHQKRN